MSRIAYISGRPGAGKTSLAFPLAAELGYSLVTKDLVKEALHDALYVPGEGKIDLAWSRRLGAASFAMLWMLAAHAGDMVIEANFHPDNDEALAQLRALGGRTLEVHCACPAEVAHARYNARSRHEVHRGTLPLSAMYKYDRPVGIGPLITVDTTGPVDVAAVAAEVRRLHTSTVSSSASGESDRHKGLLFLALRLVREVGGHPGLVQVVGLTARLGGQNQALIIGE